MPGAGIEPARPKAPDFKSGMSTSSIIRACKNKRLQPLVTRFQGVPKPAPVCPSEVELTDTQVILSPLRLPISPSGQDLASSEPAMGTKPASQPETHPKR